MTTKTASDTFVVGTTLANATPIAFEPRAVGYIYNNSGGAVNITVHASGSKDGSDDTAYVLASDVGTSGVLAAIPDGEGAEIPTKLAGTRWLKFVDAAASNAVVTVSTKGS